MKSLKPKYITDKKGNRISVVLPINEYQNILEQLDILEDITLYDKAKKSNTIPIPAEEVFNSIEKKRKDANTLPTNHS